MRHVVYRHYDKNDKLLYVGCTRDIIQRTEQHVTLKDWAHEIVKITLEHYENKKDALIAEEKYQLTENAKYCLPAKLTREQTIKSRYQRLLNWLTDEWQSSVGSGIDDVTWGYFKKATREGYAIAMQDPDIPYRTLYKKAK